MMHDTQKKKGKKPRGGKAITEDILTEYERELMANPMAEPLRPIIDRLVSRVRAHEKKVIPAAMPQPVPTGNGSEILPLVIVDIQARAEAGLQKYGTLLRAHNGRDCLMDAYQEAIDLVMYLRQVIAERATTPPDPPTPGTLCPECGYDVKVDVEGCCLACGATAFGRGADEAIRYRAVATARPPDENETCEWTEDRDGYWSTDCGQDWVFNDDGPVENGVVFCFRCGKRVKAEPYEEEVDMTDEKRPPDPAGIEAVRARITRTGKHRWTPEVPQTSAEYHVAVAADQAEKDRATTLDAYDFAVREFAMYRENTAYREGLAFSGRDRRDARIEELEAMRQSDAVHLNTVETAMGSRIKELEAERDSWRRTCETLTGERDAANDRAERERAETERLCRVCNTISIERDALAARVGRLRSELKTLGETEHRSWHGLNTYYDFALWAQNRARAALKEDEE